MMNVEYFIKKFEAIPEEKWCVNVLHNLSDQKCANGHCGVYSRETLYGQITIINDESIALQKVFSRLEVNTIPGVSISKRMENRRYSSKAAVINNGHAIEYQQETPKQRILAALRDIQLLEEQDRVVQEIQTIVNQPDELKQLV